MQHVQSVCTSAPLHIVQRIMFSTLLALWCPGLADSWSDGARVLQVALSGDGTYLVVHAPLSYSRQYNIPGNDNSGNVYTYKLVSSHPAQRI